MGSLDLVLWPCDFLNQSSHCLSSTSDEASPYEGVLWLKGHVVRGQSHISRKLSEPKSLQDQISKWSSGHLAQKLRKEARRQVEPQGRRSWAAKIRSPNYLLYPHFKKKKICRAVVAAAVHARL